MFTYQIKKLFISLVLIECFCFYFISQSKEGDSISEKTEKIVKYYPTGEKMAEGQKKGNKLVGKWVVWWKNGNISRIVNYDEEGEYHGEQLFFAPDGRFVMKIYYIHGKKVSEEDFKKYEKDQKNNLNLQK
jgi:antitoxin component YwqK of YwqJK toxin-antitoxin module